eukprot:CAMPEP_0202893840 /NCGR_PEP_ID=MMETSP1392-20130828/3347_1 /ASSEMBLY_ACC=CAM_ASM_000868 /TAXON_ID=225041 /ORGANISM="Chlamydomonas chlamydogama, Strain SAG 11-48b" /LENGTH=128 /DNA_ID=CAMNT_0049578321 /DNA_START=102 /DNA_END=489 /DNA_ORIENTATION=-
MKESKIGLDELPRAGCKHKAKGTLNFKLATTSPTWSNHNRKLHVAGNPPASSAPQPARLICFTRSPMMMAVEQQVAVCQGGKLWWSVCLFRGSCTAAAAAALHAEPSTPVRMMPPRWVETHDANTTPH